MIADESCQIIPYGDSAIFIIIDSEINAASNLKIQHIDKWLQQNMPTGFSEIIPAYSSLVITYDPLQIKLDEALSLIKSLVKNCPHGSIEIGRLLEVPVVYGGEFGEDLASLANFLGLSEEEVIHLHSQVEYSVAMMGFTPGFVYLSGLDERLHMPRKSTPRTLVPAGSVGIAGGQTGIYSIDSPGGWQLIGRTTLVLFDPGREKPFLFEPGDRVRFIPRKAELGLDA